MREIDLLDNHEAAKAFWARVQKAGHDECWLWQAGLNQGYGIFRFAGAKIRAHRAALIITGTIPPVGLVAAHSCRSRACVNPAHLSFVTVRENSLVNSKGATAKNAARTHCRHGHELSAENNTGYAARNGWRECLVCKRVSYAKYRASGARLRRPAPLRGSGPSGLQSTFAKEN